MSSSDVVINGLNAEYLYIVKKNGEYVGVYNKPNEKNIRIKMNSNIIRVIHKLEDENWFALVRYTVEKKLKLKNKVNSFSSYVVRMSDQRKSLGIVGGRESVENVSVACMSVNDFLKCLVKALSSSYDVHVSIHNIHDCGTALNSYDMEI